MACKLGEKTRQAPGFYLTIAVATLAGIVLNFLHIDPIRALFWAAVLNGVLAAPLMAVIMHMASSSKVMDRFTLPMYLRSSAGLRRRLWLPLDWCLRDFAMKRHKEG